MGMLLDIRDLKVYYSTLRGSVKAVDGISFSIGKGRSYGLVGESGCGKTTVALAITRLLPPNGEVVGGEIRYNGIDLLSMREEELKRKIRWKKISIVFQGSLNALNPVFTVGDQIAEAILLHEDVDKEEARQRAMELLSLVRIPTERVDYYPHELSGGQRQRVMIAMALACNPEFTIFDEPTTALDVITQAQIL
ncbi:MAG TPA: ABC transporter ATP-binding protein, partial [Candidatus Korarchaeota archaeon]|nr:ABC transporter ATP-binding protein [Candidatus Korarchaeota archaeon]